MNDIASEFERLLGHAALTRPPSSRASTSMRFSSRLLISTTPIGFAASKPHDQEEED